MKLMAVIFFVWFAQAQGTSTAATTTAPGDETTTTAPGAGTTTTAPGAGTTTTVPVAGTTTTAPGAETTTTAPGAGTTTTAPGAATTSTAPGAKTTLTSNASSTSQIQTSTGTGVVTSTVVVTVPTTPAPNCTASRAPATLSIVGESPCSATKINNQTIQFKSPNFPKVYPNSVECEAETSSDGPRTLEITPKLFSVHESDKLIIKGPFGYKKRIQNADLNLSISLPSAYAKFEFTSNDKKNNKGFKLNIKSKKNSCQKICSLQAGTTDYITNGVYAADTFCEWWMEAPTGCFIRLNFEKFDVGTASPKGGPSSCKGDYIGVNRNGDPCYGPSSSKVFCGSILPNATRSVDNKINVLFNGHDGGYNGFKIKYTVVC